MYDSMLSKPMRNGDSPPPFTRWHTSLLPPARINVTFFLRCALMVFLTQGFEIANAHSQSISFHDLPL